MLSITASHKQGTESARSFQPVVSIFGGGESNVVLPKELIEDATSIVILRIHALCKNADDIMQLLLLTDAVRRVMPDVPVHLDLPYVPYGRQDRVCNTGEALSLKVMANLINSQGYASVTVIDPHSDVTGALIDRVRVIDPSVALRQVLADVRFTKGVTLVAPDAGARKRVLSLAKKLGLQDVRFADKVRDPKGGAITAVSFPEDLPPQPILIVDDIIDGGRTFLELAKAAKAITDQPLYLYATHGIFSRGLDELKKHYEHIFTVIDWTQSGDAQLSVINL